MGDKDLIFIGESGSKLNNNGGNHVEDVNDKLVEDIDVSRSVSVVSGEGIGSSSSLLLSLSLSADVDKRKGLKKWRRIPRELGKKMGSSFSTNENGDMMVSSVRRGMLNVNGDYQADSDGGRRASGADSDMRMSNEISELNGDDDDLVLVSVLADDHQGNGRLGSGKKARAGFKTEKENLNSDLTMGVLGTDSGRSNFVFLQGSKTVASEGGPSGSFAEHDESSSGDKDLNEEAQIAFVKSDAESDDVSVAADNIEKHEGLMEHDPLVESINGLQSAQEEFEREVRKWRDIGKHDPLLFDDPIQEILELKDAKILELELALSSEGIKTELEDCLMKIIQADVENVVLTTTTKRLTEGPLREIKHNLQLKNVSSQGVQATDVTLEAKDEDLKKLQHRVCSFTLCLIIQLILFLLTLFMNFSPHNENVEVVPT